MNKITNCTRCNKSLHDQILHNGIVDFNLCNSCDLFKRAEKICLEVFGYADVGEISWEDVETLIYILKGQDERQY